MKNYIITLDNAWASGKKIFIKSQYPNPESVKAVIKQRAESIKRMTEKVISADSSPGDVARLESTMQNYGFIGHYSVGYVDKFLVNIEEFKEPEFSTFI